MRIFKDREGGRKTIVLRACISESTGGETEAI